MLNRRKFLATSAATGAERLFACSPWAATAALPLAPAAGADDPNMFGVWWRGGPDAADLKRQAPFVTGVFVAIAWSDLEPVKGQYNWKLFDETFARYARAGLFIQFMIWVGPDSPRWIYANGVPEVKTTPTLDHYNKPVLWTYPFYLHQNYQDFYFRMLRDVAAHVDTLPQDVRRKVICVQTAEGTTGDEGGYKGNPLDSAYELPEDQWQAFKHKTWELFDSLYSPKQPKIHLLMNSGNRGEYNDWLNEHLPNAWRKAGNPGHGYQLNDEKDMYTFFDPLINHPESGHLIRARSEMDEMDHGWFQQEPLWNMYWLNLWGLFFGLDIFQHETPAFENRAFDEGFRFYTKYGGRKDPASSPGAWCALRDGLDAADTRRFPPATFGPGAFRGDEANRSAGLQRTLRIADAFAAFGAKQQDPKHAMQPIMQNRQMTHLNDVGWNIEAGNYERYMTQWEPNTTSQGYWRQGPEDQPYGRFARGFDTAKGKSTMYFDIQESFFGMPRKTGATPSVALRVVYLDRGTGAFSVKYDSSTSPVKTAVTVRKTGSGRWKETKLLLKDGAFRNRCPHNTDLMLVSEDSENTLFHMVEVTRV